MLKGMLWVCHAGDHCDWGSSSDSDEFPFFVQSRGFDSTKTGVENPAGYANRIRLLILAAVRRRIVAVLLTQVGASDEDRGC